MRPIERRLDKLSSTLCRLLADGKCYLGNHEGHEPHHIVSRNHKRQRWNMDNLVYLCRTCHRKAHDEGLDFGRELDGRVRVWSLPELQELEKEIKLKIRKYS